MDRSRDHADIQVERALELELTLVRDAIAMVVGGGARRVTVGGLRFGEALLVPARRLANEAGVRLVPLWTADDAGADIAIESIADD